MDLAGDASVPTLCRHLINGNVAFIEMLSWNTGRSSTTAHEIPAVMRLWKPMGAFSQQMEF